MYARTKMSRKACREYLEVMQGRYAAAGHRKEEPDMLESSS